MKNRSLLKRMISISLIAFMGFSTGIVAFADKEKDGNKQQTNAAAAESNQAELINKLLAANAANQTKVSLFDRVLKFPEFLNHAKWFLRELHISSAWNKYIAAPWNAKYNGFRNRDDINEKLRQLFVSVKGHLKAKEQIRDFVNAALDDFDKFEAGIQPPRGHVLILAGPSGNGKSMLAEGTMKALFKSGSEAESTPFSGASYIMLSSGSILHGNSSVKEQLFTMTSASEGSYNQLEKPVMKTSGVADFMSMHCRGGGICLDEFDKMCTRDDGSTDRSIDELLRNYVDHGILTIMPTEVIPCFKSIFILTTNEKQEDLVNDFFDSKLGPKEDNSSEQSPTSADDDEKQIRKGVTQTKRDRSALNRYKVVMLGELSKADYAEIIKQFVLDDSKYREQKWGFKWKLDESSLAELVEQAANTNGGMHIVRRILSDQTSRLSRQITELFKAKKIDVSGKEFTIYCNSKGEFKLKYNSPADSLAQVAFKKPADWKTPYVYFYKTLENGTEESFFEWPGIPMYSENEDDTYQHRLPADFCAQGVRVMFNDGAGRAQIPAADEPGFELSAAETGTFDGENWKTEFAVHGDPIPEPSCHEPQPQKGTFEKLKDDAKGLFGHKLKEEPALCKTADFGRTAAVASASKIKTKDVAKIIKSLGINNAGTADTERILNIFREVGVNSRNENDLKCIRSVLKRCKKCESSALAIQEIQNHHSFAQNISISNLQFIFDVVHPAKLGDSLLEPHCYLPIDAAAADSADLAKFDDVD